MIFSRTYLYFEVTPYITVKIPFVDYAFSDRYGSDHVSSLTTTKFEPPPWGLCQRNLALANCALIRCRIDSKNRETRRELQHLDQRAVNYAVNRVIIHKEVSYLS